MPPVKTWTPILAAFAFGILVALFASRFLLPKPEAPMQVAVPPAPPTPRPSKANAVIVKSLPKRPPPPVKGEDPARHLHEDDPDIVEFHVSAEGLAIAFGDVILGEPDAAGGKKPKNGYYRPDPPQLWKDEIPYSIDAKLEAPERVKRAVDYFNRNTRVRFVPFRGQEDAIVFLTGKEHCHSYLGRVGGHQPIFLSPKCGQGEILHEMLHALGFIHEQSRGDRDRYVQILWQNIKPEFRSQFDIVPTAWMGATKDTPFDYNSIMLYRANSFALRPDLITMQGITGGIAPFEDELSTGDLDRLSRLYR